jgi:hypothetical protein
MSNEMYKNLSRCDRVDRTTYVEAARLPTYLINKYRDIEKSFITPKLRATNYVVRDLIENCSNPTFDGVCPPDFELVDDETTGTFTSLLIEENAQFRSANDTTFTANISEAIQDNSITKAILLTRLEKWLYASINGSIVGDTTHCPTELPTAWKIEVMTEAVCSVSFRILRPYSRTAILRNFSTFIANTAGMSTTESLENPVTYDKYIRAVQETD